MNKYFIVVIICGFILSFFSPLVVNASGNYIGTVTASSGVRVRSGAGTNHSQVDFLLSGSTVDLVSTTLYKDESGCPDGWYNIYYDKDKTGFTCSTYLDIREEIIYEDNKEPATEYEKILQQAGFPSSYWPSLTSLHEAHPSWKFVALDTQMTFDSAVSSQSTVGKSLIQTSYEGYLSTSDASFDYLTDTFRVLEGSNWYAADDDVVAYYLDPRNFLNETSIFMFEKLGYDDSITDAEYIAAISGMLGSSYLTGHINDFLLAGKTYDVNPIYLVSLAVQETGYNGGSATNGSSFSYTQDGITKNYSGIYNIFNIGAYTGTNPVVTGLLWAAGGFYQTGTSYGRAWTTLASSISGGANFISDGYISKGQHSTYLKKFNVNPDAYWNVHTHQYQTNIMAPLGEADKSFNAYESASFLDLDFIFEIPVFYEMPSETNLPDKGNPNNHLSMISVNGTNVLDFQHDRYIYDVYVAKEAKSVKINSTVINKDATVSLNGDVDLPTDETVIKVAVTAENGSIQEYTLNVVKTDGLEMTAKDVVNNSTLSTDGSYVVGSVSGSSVENMSTSLQNVSNAVKVDVKSVDGGVKTSGKLGTGDSVTITNGNSVETFTVVVKGDNDGDGEITILDSLAIRKDILNYSKLETYNFKASDIDNNGVVDILDSLLVRKHILGYEEIK